MYYFINNTFIHSSKAKISFHDSGFLFGDGLFETMRFDKGEIFSINNHLNRLMKGLKIIDLKIDKSKNELTKILYEQISKSKFKKMSKYVKEYKKNFSWDFFIKGIEKVYSQL